MNANDYRRWANRNSASAQKWEQLAKDFKNIGELQHAIECAQHAREKRRSAKEYTEKANER